MHVIKTYLIWQEEGGPRGREKKLDVIQKIPVPPPPWLGS